MSERDENTAQKGGSVAFGRASSAGVDNHAVSTNVGNSVDSQAETVFTKDMTSSNFADTTNYSIERVWGGPCDHLNCEGDAVAFITINFSDGGSVGGYCCLTHLNTYEAAYGLPRTGGVPTGRTGEDSLDAERDHTSGAVPVGARSPHTTTCFSRLPGSNPCDCKARAEAWR